jgi:hypothetical protein
MGKGVAFLTREQAAAELGVSVETLAKMPVRRFDLGGDIVRYPFPLVLEDLVNGVYWTQRQPSIPAPTPRKSRCPSLTVYVIRARPSGKLKIGQAVHAERRLEYLQTGTWERLELILTIPDDRNLERDLHKRFASDRLAGEWFEPSPAILAWLREMGAAV